MRIQKMTSEKMAEVYTSLYIYLGMLYILERINKYMKTK